MTEPSMERSLSRAAASFFGMPGDWVDVVLVPARGDANDLVLHLRETIDIPQFATVDLPAREISIFGAGARALSEQGNRVVVVDGRDPTENDVMAVALLVRTGQLPIVSGLAEDARARTVATLPPGLMVLDACRTPAAWVVSGRAN